MSNQFSAGVKTATDKISKLKVKTKKDMKDLLYFVQGSIAMESPQFTAEKQQMVKSFIDQFEYQGGANLPEPHNALYPQIFKVMRQQAQQANAPQTDAAILSAASWYYYNIEKPKTSSASPASYGVKESETQSSQFKSGQKRRWMTFGLLGASGLLGLTLLYFAFKPKAKKNPARRAVTSRTKREKVNSRIKSRRKTLKRKKTPIRLNQSTQSSALSQYKKKYQSSKRKGLKLRKR